MAQVPMRMPPVAAAQHLVQANVAPPQHILAQSPGAPAHLVQQATPSHQHLMSSPLQQHHLPPQNAQQHHMSQAPPPPQQHHMPQNGVAQQQQHLPQSGVQQHHLAGNSAGTLHVVQQRPLPAQHQTIQGVAGHTPGSHPSPNHVIMSQYAQPPTSHPPPLPHLVEGRAGYSRQNQYGRPPPVMVEAEKSDCNNAKEKTPMCLVNELARFNKVQHQYKLTDESGPAHKKSFSVCLKIGDKEDYVASGPSIKKAQHAAAAIALEKTQFKHPPPKPANSKTTNVTPTVELNSIAMKRGEPANYTFVEPTRANQFNNRNRTGSFPPMFAVQLKVGSNEFTGEGLTAQAARHSAASQALKLLKDSDAHQGKSKLDPTSNPFIPGTEYDELKSPISLVHEVALKRNLHVAFTVVQETGPPHMRMFVTRCTVGDFICDGEGNGKKISKKKSAELMLKKLRQLPPVASAVLPKQRKQPNTKKKSKNLIKVETKEDAEPKQSINPISRLIQIQQAKKEKEPVYTLIGERGMPRRREFFMKVTVGANSAVGSGPNKKVAKRAAAEALLQMTGYSRPSAAPVKPAIKQSSDSSDKSKKLSFVDEVEEQVASGPAGRQLVPGLLYIDDSSSNINGKAKSKKTLPDNSSSVSQAQAATIAKEFLSDGTSPTADQLVKEAGTTPLPTLPTQGQGVSSKEQLAYLSQVLGFTVTYNDFPKKGEYLTLVSLSTNPPQVSHGSGQSLESSHNNAAHTALNTLADNGIQDLDTGRRQQ